MFEENLTSFSCKMNIFESKVNYLFLGKVDPKGILKITPKVNELQNFNVNLLENFLLSLHDLEEGVWKTQVCKCTCFGNRSGASYFHFCRRWWIGITHEKSSIRKHLCFWMNQEEKKLLCSFTKLAMRRGSREFWKSK